MLLVWFYEQRRVRGRRNIIILLCVELIYCFVGEVFYKFHVISECNQRTMKRTICISWRERKLQAPKLVKVMKVTTNVELLVKQDFITFFEFLICIILFHQRFLSFAQFPSRSQSKTINSSYVQFKNVRHCSPFRSRCLSSCTNLGGLLPKLGMLVLPIPPSGFPLCFHFPGLKGI